MRAWGRGLRGVGETKRGDREGEAPGTGEKRKGDGEQSGAAVLLAQGNPLTELRGENGNGQRRQLRAAVGAQEERLGWGCWGLERPVSMEGLGDPHPLPAAGSSGQPEGAALSPPPTPHSPTRWLQMSLETAELLQPHELVPAPTPRGALWAENGWGPHCTAQPKGV